MSDRRFLVFISGTGSNLKAIHAACQRGHIKAHLAGVVSDNLHALGIQYAQKQGLATAVLPKSFYADRQRFDDALLEISRSYRPDLIVLAGYMRILTPDFVAKAHGPILNIHPSLLPKHKGLHTHEQVLRHHDAYHGLTIHQVNAELDAGPPILQVQFRITEGDSAASLQQKVQKLEHFWYPEVLSWWASGRLVIGNPLTRWDGNPIPPQGISFCAMEGADEPKQQHYSS